MRTTLINYYQIVLMEKIGLVGGLIIRDMQIQMDMRQIIQEVYGDLEIGLSMH